jgi:hypothetical protein
LRAETETGGGDGEVENEELDAEDIENAIDSLSENDRHHILKDKHNWNKFVPDPQDPNNWHKIATIISTVLANGAEQLYKNGPAYIRSLDIDGRIVEVTYRIIDGIIRISNAWVT